jgi:transcriptional regulator with XRE-family HTH domain
VDYQAARQRLGGKLRELRAARGWTQEQLADAVSKTTEHISYLERGERSPSFELLLDIAHALQTSPSVLLSGDDPEGISDVVEALAVAPTSAPLPEPAQGSVPVLEQRQSDLERLNAAFKGIMEMQSLAHEYGINDILQDNGGKVLQVLIILGLRISPGREGNDALDAEGNEYELKTVNRSLNKNAGVTTHHHLNKDILRKYRAVKAWYIAHYEGVVLKEIYKLLPSQLEPLFQQWEQKIEAGTTALNNPKIPVRVVRSGERVYPAPDSEGANSEAG